MTTKVTEIFKTITFILAGIIVAYVISISVFKESSDKNSTAKPCSVIDPTCVYQLGKRK